jgi:hypothetical protein
MKKKPRRRTIPIPLSPPLFVSPDEADTEDEDEEPAEEIEEEEEEEEEEIVQDAQGPSAVDEIEEEVQIPTWQM